MKLLEQRHGRMVVLVFIVQAFSAWGLPSLPPSDLIPTPIPNPSPTPYAAWINGLSDQSDYFPIAVWLQNPSRATEYQAIGINLYVGLWQGPTAGQVSALTAAGMPVICEQNAYALAHLDNPIFVGWSQMDEPDNAQRFETFWQNDPDLVAEAWPEYAGNSWGTWGPPASPSQVTNRYQEIIGHDDSRPVFLNLGQGVAWDGWGGRGVRTGHTEDFPQYAKGGDILAFDIYPAVHSDPDIAGELWRVPYGVKRLRGWSEEKPTWADIECTHISNANIKPTPQQVKSEVWMSLIFGARGILYFCHQFEPNFIEAALLIDPEMMSAVSTINAQIQGLAPILNSQSITGKVNVTSSNPGTPVRMMVKRHDDSLYVFSAAMYDEATTATFTVQSLKSTMTVEVLGEGRTLTATNGLFTDSFSSNDVHLYKMPLDKSGFILMLK